jgi:hypothetical protein
VFVVGERVTPAQYRKHPTACPHQLRLATLDHCNMAERPENQSLLFYSGKRPADGKPFSFVPCHPIGDADAIQGHDRVILGYKEFDLLCGKKGFFRQGCGRLKRSAQGTSDDAILKFWTQIADQCRCQGFFLGHSIELTPIKADLSTVGLSRF